MGDMRITNLLVAVGLTIAVSSPAAAVRAGGRAQPARSAVTARAAILIDNQTGEVLWERNPDLALPPASTTKVLTAMVALRSGRLEDSILVSKQASLEPPSKIHLRAGWRLRLLDLIYAIMLNSANDASVVIAEGLAGSVPAFSELMNAQAERLGATNSHFVNPNGLPAADHYSTARDLATLFSVAVRDPVFDRIVSTRSIPIIPTEGAVRAITLRTHNRLLASDYRYDVVGKTGWTIAAKRCFVGAARAGDRELIVAVLGANDLWGDVRKLIEFGFHETDRPDVQMATVDADERAVRARAAGDDDDDDAAAARLRTKRRLRAASVNRSGSSKTAARTSVQRPASRSKASAQLAATSKSKPARKRKQSAAANQVARIQTQRTVKAPRPAVAANSVARSRTVAAKGATKPVSSRASRVKKKKAAVAKRMRTEPTQLSQRSTTTHRDN